MFDGTTVYVLGVVLVATLVRSSIGFGEALVAVPLLVLRIPLAVAAPLAVSISAMVAALIVAQDWREIEGPSARWLVVSSLFGIPFGLRLLTSVDDRIVRAILGLVIVAFSAYSLTMAARMRFRAEGRGWLVCAGFISGVLGGAYGMNGPPLAIYGALRGWSPQQFRATLQGYFLVASVVGLIGYAVVGLWSAAVTRYLVLSLPCVFVGIVGGRRINQRLRGGGFFRVVYVGLIAIGTILIGEAIAG